jgi:hypothetical protein
LSGQLAGLPPAQLAQEDRANAGPAQAQHRMADLLDHVAHLVLGAFVDDDPHQ